MSNMTSFFAPLFAAIVVFWVLSRLVVSRAYEHRVASEIGSGQLEFAPNKRNKVAAAIFIALLAYAAISQVVNGFSHPVALIGAAFWLVIAATILCAFPGTIIADSRGLRQVFWLWKKKPVAWKDVRAVDIDEKNERVTIRSVSGTKIIHTRQLPDKTRLLTEVAKRCGDKLPAELRAKTETEHKTIACA
jgi:hypothetical protein